MPKIRVFLLISWREINQTNFQTCRMPCLGAEAEPAVLRSCKIHQLVSSIPTVFFQRPSDVAEMFSIDTGQMATRNWAVENLRLVVETPVFTWFHQQYYYIIWICFSNIFPDFQKKTSLRLNKYSPLNMDSWFR